MITRKEIVNRMVEVEVGQAEISRVTGIHVSTVNRCLNNEDSFQAMGVVKLFAIVEALGGYEGKWKKKAK